MLRPLAAIGMSLILASCVNLYSVRSSSGRAATGVPFLAKEAKLFQVTKAEKLHLSVQFKMTLLDPASGKEVEWLAPEVPLELNASDKADKELRNVLGALTGDRSQSEQEFANSVASLLKDRGNLFLDCGVSGGQICVDPRSRYVRVLENRFEVQSVLSPNTYYLNTRMPWVGSSSVTAKLAGDGTLTESSSETDNQTVSTILAALPAQELAGKWFGLGEGDSVSKALSDRSRNPEFDIDGLDKPRREERLVSLVVQGVYWQYTLRRSSKDSQGVVEPLSYGPSLCESPPSSQEAPPKGSCGVELVSVVTKSEEKPKDSSAKSAWSISGEIKPPDDK
jgi:hypothetical protein